MISKLLYAIELDYLPFRRFIVWAESESEARLQIAESMRVAYDQTSARLI